MPKYIALLILLCLTYTTHSQNTFGRITQDDFDFKVYEKDSTANAVVLYEKGDFKFKVISNSIFLIKSYTVKIKILNIDGANEANVDIPFYHNKQNTEKVYDIAGITHNGMVKTNLRQEDIYEVDNTENWSSMRFTLPNIKEGSIIQYKYNIKTPFFFNLDGWDFQSNIPKLYSEFNAEIPLNYIYNRVLFGFLKLDIEDAKIEKRCFIVDGPYEPTDCEILKYAMKDIPAFDDDEQYMLAPSNYKSRLDFELAIHYKFDGTKKKYAKNWEDVDKEFKKDKDIGRQLTKNYFFEKNLPQDLLNEKEPLTRAQNIYKFVQNHFTWNGKYGIYKNIRVKDAFNAGTGNVGEINIALINLLKAADIKTDIMLTATRNRALPKKNQPVISDFNYIIARVEIDGTTYLLDASSKLHPFGILPFRCLNIYGRVMDFKEASYWQDIVPEQKNEISFFGVSKFNPITNEINGRFREINTGYEAITRYNRINTLTKEEYLNTLEDDTNNFFVDNYIIEKSKNNDRKVIESYDFTVENIADNDNLYITPIFKGFFEKNPFIKEKRKFPVEFGFPRKYSYTMSLEIPATYQIKTLPKSRTIALPSNAGLLKFVIRQQENLINIRYQFELNKTYFIPEAYSLLKEFYKNALEIEQKELIALVKKTN